MESTQQSTRPRPLRLWPGVAIVVLQWICRFVVPVVAPEAGAIAVLGGLVGGIAILLWWLLLSRAPWSERLGGVVLVIAVLALTPNLLHVSIATGNMGFMFFIFAIPVVSLAFVAWAVFSERLPGPARWATMVAAVVLASLPWAFVRTGGNTTDFDHDFAWRWTPTAEERLLAMEAEPTSSPSGGRVAENGAVWPGFRGPDRDSKLAGVKIATDWQTSPPVELWRRPIGPGWSSFAVLGDLLYTQEQRGEDEVVSCYDAKTGEPVWRHEDAARFWESVGGAGPRGTPTLDDDRVYTFGATGLLNVLNALDGTEIWSRDTAADTGTEVPYWGFSSSPLVLEDLVVVAVSGALVAYDIETGEQRWTGPVGDVSYSSPQLVTLDGREQILQLHGDGLAGVVPEDGTLLWQHDWEGYPIVQPALTADGDILISTTDRSGTRRVAIEGNGSGWKATEQWTTEGLKSYFNDFVIHEGHAYGFDGRILAAIDVETGERRWKGGRYGGGQLILLSDQDLLLVMSEKGDLALVAAKPDGFEEIAKVPAIEGKTWNHPVLAGDRLFVRNSEEMAAFRIALANR